MNLNQREEVFVQKMSERPCVLFFDELILFLNRHEFDASDTDVPPIVS